MDPNESSQSHASFVTESPYAGTILSPPPKALHGRASAPSTKRLTIGYHVPTSVWAQHASPPPEYSAEPPSSSSGLSPNNTTFKSKKYQPPHPLPKSPISANVPYSPKVGSKDWDTRNAPIPGGSLAGPIAPRPVTASRAFCSHQSANELLVEYCRKNAHKPERPPHQTIMQGDFSPQKNTQSTWTECDISMYPSVHATDSGAQRVQRGFYSDPGNDASTPSLTRSSRSPVETPFPHKSNSEGASCPCSDLGVCTDYGGLDDKHHGPEATHDGGERLQRKSGPGRMERKLISSYNAFLNPHGFVTPGVDLTVMELKSAANLPVFDQEGRRQLLGELFENQTTCVIFIRHFLCPFCADYMRAIVREVAPEVLEKANVKLIVISHGSPHMIKTWKSIFNLPYEVYTDPSRKIHRALNMTIRTVSGGPKSERGDYLEHNLTLGLARVGKNAIKAKMPLYRYPGDFFQVGGEFVFGPGMHNTASHAPIREVIRAAGVELHVSLDPAIKEEYISQRQEWEMARRVELERIRTRKVRRRGLVMDGEADHWAEPISPGVGNEDLPISHIDIIDLPAGSY